MESKDKLVHRALLVAKKEIAAGWYLFDLEAPLLARAAPGQFVQLRIGSRTDPLLRRPLSVHYADPERGRIRLLSRVSGGGTALAASYRQGEELDLLGPLGQGFPFLDREEPALLVGGGIGMAPLYFAAVQRRRAALPFELLLGGRSSALLPPDDYFSGDRLRPLIVTDDGSRGGKGTVTALLEQRLEKVKEPLRVHACGPAPMLARVVELARSAGAAVYLSLEARMGCGVGACLGCVHPFLREGRIEYRRVCRDGPVFDGEEVYFGD
ncbi:MAG: dihydroorotate dehydrogenase electron transfer subunit [Firmicutes bacterium]|jgi:dihydroorotate dehydrogenase electron transfer subunit|nr:dihydroorotate dehydrogenase electron transfer subunit [Bacillota bacterium]